MTEMYLRNFNLVAFLAVIKEKTGLNDSQIAKKLKISKSMIWRYNNNLNPLRYSFYVELCGLVGMDKNSFDFELFCPRNHSKSANIPELDENLSEFIGILLGDGHLSKKGHGIIITGGKADGDYITKYVPKLMKNLFRKTPKTYFLNERGTIIQTLFYSKLVCEYLAKEYTIPIGKKHEINIPQQVLENEFFLMSCLRGLVDTDGGVYRHNKKSIQVCFYNSSKSLLAGVNDGFVKVGLKPHYYWNKRRERGVVSICGSDVNKYFKKIGSNNPKNQAKFFVFEEYGEVPKNTEIENFKSNIFL